MVWNPFCNLERGSRGIFDKIRSTFGNAEHESGTGAEAGEKVKDERRRSKRLNARDDTRAYHR